MKKKSLSLPGQQKFKSMKAALKHITDTMAKLHLEAHTKLQRNK